MVPHIGDRGVTLRRYPNGVDAQSFFEKRCASHRPDWIGVFAGPGDRNGTIGYCALDSTAALAWSANMAALEVHAPMARGNDIESPTMCVFDLDPGPRTGIPECAEVALQIRDVLDNLAGLECLPKTSGSKGLQVYVPLNTGGRAKPTHEHCSEFAQAVAQVLEKHHPGSVTSTMAKSARPGRSSSTGARTAVTRRRWRPTPCGPGHGRRSARRSRGTRWRRRHAGTT
jgi:bifunctional non-homologous end joining protein LigD